MDTESLSSSEQAWLRDRDRLRRNRHDLTAAAAGTYPELCKVADTPLLTRPEWIPTGPIPLDAIEIRQSDDSGRSFTELHEAAAASLPTHADGTRYASYAEAIRELAAPAVFEDRTTYRLLDAVLDGDAPRLEFGRGSYFDGVNTGEAAAHEFARQPTGTPEPALRTAIGDPCELHRRPANLAISTLTVRRDLRAGDDRFLLHWRDPARVGHAGGMYQVIPVGVFQPSGEAPWNWRHDFSLWHSTVREFAEELGRQPEDYGSESAPIDYQSWEFAVRLEKARAEGKVQAYCVGLGVDPLSFATDLLTVVIVDADVFDEMFGSVVDGGNAEGYVLDMKPFTAESLEQTVAHFNMQAAGAAVLRLASQLVLVQR